MADEATESFSLVEQIRAPGGLLSTLITHGLGALQPAMNPTIVAVESISLIGFIELMRVCDFIVLSLISRTYGWR
jgi:hypothetical protein